MTLRILLIGPAPAGAYSRGGMATVMSAMLDHPDPRLSVRCVETFRDTATVRRLAHGVLGMLRATALILAGRVDVVHVHLSHGGSVLRKALPLWAARLRGIPAVIHGHSYNFGQWYGQLPGLVRAVVTRALPADHVLVLGSGLVDDYRAIGRRVSVLHNPAPECSAVQSDSVRAVSFGRIGERKGSFDVIRALALVPQSVRDRVDCLLAGDGDVAPAQQLAATVLPDTKPVARVRGWLDPHERDALLADASIFLLPSYDEGLPMALLEAMAAGLVPVVTLVGAIGDVVTDDESAIVVAPGDTEAIAAAIIRLATDEKLRRRLADGAQATARAMSIHRWYDELAHLWIGLADARQ